MANQRIDLDLHTKQLSEYQKHSKRKTEEFREQSKAIKEHIQTSSQSREEALAKEIAELKQLTKRHVSFEE